ncbi:unnamed protein product [Trifolium pratense]|uniref:Uncharacterized protein n=1 Tax=Trifolium pratense TaxID=57577 RepID=A0ACB0LDB0_TRIPR|nr:unnamed protein product [Trifolium pratense]
MAKTLKLVSAIILIVFLFYILEEVASTEEEEITPIPFRLTPTIVKCTSSKDCPEITVQPGLSIAVCSGGYCQT